MAEKYFPDEPPKAVAARLSRRDVAVYSLLYHFGPVTSANHHSKTENSEQVRLGFGAHGVTLDYPRGLGDGQIDFLQRIILVSDNLDPNGHGRNRIKPLLWGGPT